MYTKKTHLIRLYKSTVQSELSHGSGCVCALDLRKCFFFLCFFFLLYRFLIKGSIILCSMGDTKCQIFRRTTKVIKDFLAPSSSVHLFLSFFYFLTLFI